MRVEFIDLTRLLRHFYILYSHLQLFFKNPNITEIVHYMSGCVVLPAVRRTTYELVHCTDRFCTFNTECVSLFAKIVDYNFLSYSF